MRAHCWPVRTLALIQMLLALPLLVSGSICMPVDGCDGSELGFCACTLPSAGDAEAVIGAPGTADCGPCRDQAFHATRCDRPPAPGPPALAPVGPPVAVAGAHPVGARGPWAGDPPGRLLPILRC